MGWESLAFAGFNAMNAVNTVNQGTDQAKALAQQGTYQAKNIADDTVRSAGKLQTSFLQSGLLLDDGPNAVISQAFNKGYTDIGRTIDNANNASKNTVASARTKALQSLGQNAAMLSSGGGGSNPFEQAGSYAPDSFAYNLNSSGYGNSAYNMLSISDARG